MGMTFGVLAHKGLKSTVQICDVLFGLSQAKNSSHAILWLLHFICVSFLFYSGTIFQFIETKTVLKQKVTNRLNEVHNGHQHVGRLMVFR